MGNKKTLPRWASSLGKLLLTDRIEEARQALLELKGSSAGWKKLYLRIARRGYADQSDLYPISGTGSLRIHQWKIVLATSEYLLNGKMNHWEALLTENISSAALLECKRSDLWVEGRRRNQRLISKRARSVEKSFILEIARNLKSGGLPSTAKCIIGEFETYIRDRNDVGAVASELKQPKFSAIKVLRGTKDVQGIQLQIGPRKFIATEKYIRDTLSKSKSV